MKHIVLFIFFFTLLASCKKFLDIPFPQNQVSTETTFGDDSTAQAAVYGMYSQLMTTSSVFMNGSVTIFPALSADEIYNTSPNTTNDQFYQNALLPRESSQIYNGLWRWGYANIFNSNSLIQGVEKSTKISSTLKKQFKGEALTVRALCYFYLVNLFGDVPLVLSTDYTSNSLIGNTKTSLVYEQMVKDLEEAQTLLPASYPSGRTRITTGAAHALLARVYLYMGEFAKAEQTSSVVIDDSPEFSLETDLNKVFLINSKECILGLYPVAINQNTGAGAVLLPAANAAVRPPFSITPSLLSAFEPLDKRKAAWVASKTVSGQTILYPFKYKVKNATVVSEVNVVFRLAEQFLIRAEARAKLNNLQAALEDLNRIRSRAGLPDITIGTQQEILDAIMKERRIEFMVEKGHRWLDLKRTGKAGEVLSLLKPDWQDTDTSYPIPQSEIDKNPFLRQNPGY